MTSFLRPILPMAVFFTVLSSFADARVHWLHTVHDFGAFDEDRGRMTATFLYTNVGDEPLVVTGARANCGCTTPRYSVDALAPGDTAAIVVQYDPAGRPGRFSKKVYVDTNTDPRRSTLTVTGVVIGAPSSLSGRYPVEVGPMRLSHSAALLGNIGRGHVKSVFEAAYNASPDTLRPVVTDTPKWLEVTTVPAVVPPGEQTSFNFFIHSDRIPQWDMVTDTVTVRPFAGSPDVLRMPVVVTVTEDFSKLSDADRAKAPVAVITPRRLEPLTVDGRSTRASFTIRNDGRSALRVRRIYTMTPGVAVDIKPDTTVKPGKTLTVPVAITPAALGNKPAALINLVIVTNDPASPRTSVTIPLTQHPQPQ